MATGTYQLWDLTTGNCAAAFDDEASALAEVRAGVAEDGADSFEGMALARVVGTEVEDLGQGSALVARALATAPRKPAAGTTGRAVPATSALNPAAQTIEAHNRTMTDLARRASGMIAMHEAIQRMLAPSAALESLTAPTNRGAAWEAAQAVSAVASIAASASDALRAFGTSPAMRELTSVAEALSRLDSSKAMGELRGAAALLKGRDLDKLNESATESLRATLSASAGAEQSARKAATVGEAMANLFATGARAIAFRTTEGVVEVESTGEVATIQANEGEEQDEIVEVDVGGGITLQERVRTRQLRLVVGSLCIEVDAGELRATGD